MRGRKATIPPHVAKMKEKQYQAEYYKRHRKERSDCLKRLRRIDPEFRQREIARAKNARARARSRRASERLAESVRAKAQDNSPTRLPRWVEVDGVRQWMYGTTSFGRMVGRSPATVRLWLAQGTLPGCSLEICGRSLFTEKYAVIVKKALEEAYRYDGRGKCRVFKELVMAELQAAGETWVPYTASLENSEDAKIEEEAGS